MGYALKRFLPFKRLRLSTLRPSLVFMRLRNPCTLLRWRFLGWYVINIWLHLFSISGKPQNHSQSFFHAARYGIPYYNMLSFMRHTYTIYRLLTDFMRQTAYCLYKYRGKRLNLSRLFGKGGALCAMSKIGSGMPSRQEFCI